jgi:hypothetical protein
MPIEADSTSFGSWPSDRSISGSPEQAESEDAFKASSEEASARIDNIVALQPFS